jgi:hypothetical protein
MRFAKFSALEGGSVTVVCVAHGRDMHYTYLMSATLRCSGIVPFCGVCGQAVWYVASSHQSSQHTTYEMASHAAIQNAEAKLQQKLKEAESITAMAEAKLQQKLKEAEGITAMAEGITAMAEAKLQQKLKEAEGITAMADAAAYKTKLDADAWSYAAIQGLQPKISVWNTGAMAIDWTRPNPPRRKRLWGETGHEA